MNENQLRELARDLKKFGTVRVLLRRYDLDANGLQTESQRRLKRAVRLRICDGAEYAELSVERKKNQEA